MPRLPFLAYVDELRALRGEPKVTYPEGSTDWPTTERLLSEPLATAMRSFGSPEPDTVNFPDLVLTEQTEVSRDRTHASVYRKYDTLPGPQITRQEADGETLTPVLVTTQRIVKPSLPIAQVAGSTILYEPVTDYWGRKITTTLPNFSSVTRTEEDDDNFTFPRLITGVSVGQLVARDGSVRAYVNFSGRDAFTALAKITTTFTYNTKAAIDTAATAFTRYSPIYRNLIYDGVFWNANERGVLNDAIAVPAYTTGTSNPQWGYIVEPSVTFAASSPTAAAYTALIGTEVVISIQKTPWKYNLWRLAVRRVTLR